MNYFIHDERDLSPAYVRKCKKFFKELKEPDAWIRRKLQASSIKLQASSFKRQAPSAKRHETNTIKRYKKV